MSSIAKIIAVTTVGLVLAFGYQWISQTQASSSIAAPKVVEVAQVPRRPAIAPGQFTDEDYSRHIDAVHKRIRDKFGLSDDSESHGFAVVVQKPFVVIGDEPQPVVEQRSRNTVKWAVDHLKKQYFSKDPDVILDIWLFKDRESYNTNTELLFGYQPSTPYGFYSPGNKALIMNIATGGGTLVHELVHPFVEANFPACPAWLNEGLGSLYEQSGEENGRIHGYTNWRLPGLQRAIKAGTVPSFKDLTAMTRASFYDRDKGTNYAQARYLCYYLQEQGLLGKFYKEFYARQKDDPTGYESLQKILSEPDMDAFKKKWEKFVLELRP